MDKLIIFMRIIYICSVPVEEVEKFQIFTCCKNTKSHRNKFGNQYRYSFKINRTEYKQRELIPWKHLCVTLVQH